MLHWIETLHGRIGTTTKIAGAFGVVLALVSALALAGWMGAARLGAIIDNYATRKLPSTDALLSLRQAETAIRANASVYINPVLPAALREDARKRFGAAIERMEKGAKAYEALEHGERTAALWKEYEPRAERYLRGVAAFDAAARERAREQGAPPARLAELDRRVSESYAAMYQASFPVVETLKALLDRTAEDAKAIAAEAEASQRSVALMLAVAMGVIAAVLCALGFALSRSTGGAIRGLVREAGKVRAAIADGKLDVRGDAAGLALEFQPVIHGMNEAVDAFGAPVRVVSGVLADIARGTPPAQLQESFRGDFDEMRRNLNTALATFAALSQDVEQLVQASMAGRLKERADAARHPGMFGRLVAGMNGVLDTLVGHLDAMPAPAFIIDAQFRLQWANAVTLGIIGKSAAEVVGTRCASHFNTADCNTERCACQRAMRDGRPATSETAANVAGKTFEISYSGVPVRDDGKRVIGAFEVISDQTAVKQAMRASKKIVDYQDAEARRLVATLEGLSRGEIHQDLRVGEGDADTAAARAQFEAIAAAVRKSGAAVATLVTDMNALGEAAVAGKLGSRADAARHAGDFRKIVEGVNRTLDAVIAPVNEAVGALERLAQRDLRARMTGSYQGDHARMKEAVNVTAQALHEALAQVAAAVEQVSSAAAQIASSSQAVASGASEQAASLAETTSSIESVAGQVKASADNAQQANTLVQRARAAATEGAGAVEQMQGAMGRIKQSAEGTSLIIKDVSEIAFQTNLLALNAAVEAARAGEAGRGFAVVAEEVRSLALRAKDAASKTEELIRGSVKQAAEGEVAAKHVAGKLGEIVQGVEKVTAIVSEIAAAAGEQTSGVEQVNKAIAEMDKVTQQNAASAEESSSAASELSGQAEELAAMVGAFQLERAAVQTVGRKAPARHAPAAAPPRAAAAPKPKPNGHANGHAGAHANGAAEDPFPMDSDAKLRDF